MRRPQLRGENMWKQISRFIHPFSTAGNHRNTGSASKRLSHVSLSLVFLGDGSSGWGFANGLT
uniref:Uncharacterized protein n=1 Tax=Anopheles albimanus TaxID=7167 RepID=A0A182FYK3_ANOAL